MRCSWVLFLVPPLILHLGALWREIKMISKNQLANAMPVANSVQGWMILIGFSSIIVVVERLTTLPVYYLVFVFEECLSISLLMVILKKIQAKCSKN